MTYCDYFDCHDYRGHVVKLSADDCANLSDLGDFYGTVVGASRTWAGWVEARPAGFDGAARVLYVGRSADAYWWQPPADAARDRGLCDALSASLVRVLEEGWAVLWVERVDDERVDAYGRPIVTDYVTLGGLDPTETDEWRSYADDLIAELDALNGTETPPSTDG